MAFNLGIFFLSGFGVFGAVIVSFIGIAFALGTGALLAMRGYMLMSAMGRMQTSKANVANGRYSDIG
jgi:hypothetical protein